VGEARIPDVRPQELESVLRERRSVRHFVPARTVPRLLIERAIEAAGWAPSPHGRQPWRFSIVESIERRTSLADAMAVSWREQLALDGQDEATIRLRLAKSRERMIHASLLIIPCLYLDDLDAYPDPDRQEAERLMAIQSFGAAVQNLLLSLHASGLDAGWMCAPLFCPDLVRDHLDLSTRLFPHAMIPVGYAAREPVRRPRRCVEDLIVDWS
jgi:F420 biosynthesis protein FbiB-like protein